MVDPYIASLTLYSNLLLCREAGKLLMTFPNSSAGRDPDVNQAVRLKHSEWVVVVEEGGTSA